MTANEGSKDGVTAVGLDRDVVGMLEVLCNEGGQQERGTTSERGTNSASSSTLAWVES